MKKREENVPMGCEGEGWNTRGGWVWKLSSKGLQGSSGVKAPIPRADEGRKNAPMST